MLSACLIFAALSSCGAEGANEAPPGDLQFGLLDGDALTVGTEVPPHTPVTFGSALLCTTGGPVTLKDVTFRGALRPESVSAVARVVQAKDKRASIDPVLASRGTPAQYLSGGIRGNLVPLRGLEINVPCPVKRGSFIELLVTARASERGANVTGLTIRYTSDGHAKKLTTRFGYRFCGTATETLDTCREGS